MTQASLGEPILRCGDGDTAEVREVYALLCRLKLLRSQGRIHEAHVLAAFLELRDRADDWAQRYGT